VCVCVCVIQFSHLLRIQRRLGSQKFPLIDQSFYPNHREMMTNLWVSESLAHLTVESTSFISTAVTVEPKQSYDMQFHTGGSSTQPQ